jgi:hypothetical protein
MSALPPKAAATVANRRGSYGPRTDIRWHEWQVSLGLWAEITLFAEKSAASAVDFPQSESEAC